MIYNRCQSIVLLILINFSFIAPESFISPAAADTSGSFTGTWVANGTRDILPFGDKRETALFKLSGHVNLKDPVGMQKDYWSECIGLADTESGSNVRCVWRSLDGQEIYLVLQSKQLATGASVSGTIVGGTGSAQGIQGSVEFEWSTMSFQKNNNSTEVGGYAKDLKGSYQIP